MDRPWWDGLQPAGEAEALDKMLAYLRYSHGAVGVPDWRHVNWLPLDGRPGGGEDLLDRGGYLGTDTVAGYERDRADIATTSAVK